MHFRNHSALMAAGLGLVPFVLTVPAHAQDDLPGLVDKSLSAMKEQKWQEALAFNTQAVERFGKDPKHANKIYGPRFGTIVYRKGLCELKLKQWDAAMKSFESCYRDYPNGGANAVAGGGNQFEKMSLLKWGEAAMGAKQWQLAIDKFKKFLEERDKARDRFPQGPFYVGLAVCYYNLGKLPEGNENLEIAVKNKDKFPTPDEAVASGIQAMVVAAVAKKDEQAIIDFISKNRGDILGAPFEMARYSNIYLKAAAQTVNSGMPAAGFAIYQLIPSVEESIAGIRARINALGPLRMVRDGVKTIEKDRLEADLKVLETQRNGKGSADAKRLKGVAALHEMSGDLRGAYAAYKLLETHYQGSESREENLFNLIRLGAVVAPGETTSDYAEVFVEKFPDSKYMPLVQRLQLSSLFSKGEYETCIEVATEMLPSLKEGTAEHDMALHVLGGSLFYTGEYDKADPKLEEHYEKYPESTFRVATSYFRASNKSRLQFWKEAGRLLDDFLSKYPDPQENVYLPFALYDRANTHYALEENDAALENIARVIAEFPTCNVIDQAYNLRGNVEQTLGNRDDARKAYEKAIGIAESRGNQGVAAEAVYSLVALLGDKKEAKDDPKVLKEAVKYADKYWKQYADVSPYYKTRVAVAEMDAYESVDRFDEGLKRIQDVISERAKDPEASGLEEVINSYTEFYLRTHTPQELKEHYYSFPGIRSTDRAARALLRVAVIGVFEKVAKESEDEARKRDADAMIKVLFNELKSDFALKDLTNFILTKVGDYLRNNTATPREALPYYDEVLGRSDQSQRFAALLGRADVYGRSSNPADIEKAIEDFRRVYADSQEKGEREFASYRIVELLMEKKDYAGVEKEAAVYLDREKTGFSQYPLQVGLTLARAYAAQKKVNDALAMYIKVWGGQLGNISTSAPATLEWMKLSWDRNFPAEKAGGTADRQGAYNTGATYIQLTEGLKDKMSSEELEIWNQIEQLAKTYEADASVKSLEEQKKEKEGKR
ncbi:MAG: tetratricopeptide repeat protein [Akkermansiaceae bacterium]|nr:tetratricopeptide repeat protein [Akkermansiaceae bacterium]MCP5544447.1 tetratricopeptide repeat protein [Akkermansiaceae bacterium]MCP5548371.1 tetratricopeptide repeat protein [Akkermansiaceae bacterium]